MTIHSLMMGHVKNFETESQHIVITHDAKYRKRTNRENSIDCKSTADGSDMCKRVKHKSIIPDPSPWGFFRSDPLQNRLQDGFTIE